MSKTRVLDGKVKKNNYGVHNIQYLFVLLHKIKRSNHSLFMKKILLFSIISLCAFFVNAQYRAAFVIDKNTCQYVVPNSEKNYYVFNFEGESQSSLYNKALMAITKTYVSAKDVVTKVENSMISINSNKTISYMIGGILPTSNYVNYVLEFEFKDGRMKVNAPTIVQIRNKDGEPGRTRDFLINGKGELAQGSELYLFVNDIINNILNNMRSSSNDDW